jgi:hypothetical protein
MGPVLLTVDGLETGLALRSVVTVKRQAVVGHGKYCRFFDNWCSR